MEGRLRDHCAKADALIVNPNPSAYTHRGKHRASTGHEASARGLGAQQRKVPENPKGAGSRDRIGGILYY